MRNLVKHGLLMMTLLTVAPLLACGSDKPAQEPSSMNTTGAAAPPMNTAPPPAPMPESNPDTSMTMTPAEPPPPPPKPVEKPMTDAEIVGVTSTANTGEIEMAQLATKQAQSPEVKNYAAMMITQHRDMESKGKTITTKAKITPAESDASNNLKTEVTTTVTTLKNQKGKDFDRAYMDAQVKSHREVLTIMDDKLIPNVQSPDLKAQLSESRAKVASQLAKAEELQQKLEAAPATPAKPPPKK